MKKCVIIEDEIAGQTILQQKLNRFYPDIKILTIIDNKKDAIDYLRSHEVDIVFIDIKIKGGDGIEILKFLMDKTCEKIILTAYQQYAIEALNYGASYYLQKPIHNEEFQVGVNAVLEKIDSKEREDYVYVNANNFQERLMLSDVYYLKSDGTYTEITLKNRTILSSKNIGHFEEAIPTFVRVHHSYLVNPSKVISISSGRTSEITMINEHNIPISQRKKSEVLKLLYRKSD